MIDLTYRESDISVIPIPVENRVEHLVRDRLVDLAPSPVVVSATCATVASEALLCDKYGTRHSIILRSDNLRTIHIGFSASTAAEPTLLLLASMAPSTQALRDFLIPKDTVIDLTKLDLVVLMTEI